MAWFTSNGYFMSPSTRPGVSMKVTRLNFFCLEVDTSVTREDSWSREELGPPRSHYTGRIAGQRRSSGAGRVAISPTLHREDSWSKEELGRVAPSLTHYTRYGTIKYSCIKTGALTGTHGEDVAMVIVVMSMVGCKR
ncbi:hypothetical protein ElyMa_001124100 [Elysia marginata]|uniref:Uncharacterized protein n=1 Tax=Elysia marginata TaxID=1093978 RepID=A0AAV4HZ36_9GAST|nr:hypothetical protein ElyMa_001124100 [Elysia marginata]